MGLALPQPLGLIISTTGWGVGMPANLVHACRLFEKHPGRKASYFHGRNFQWFPKIHFRGCTCRDFEGF